MENKKFLVVYLPLLVIVLAALSYGMYDAYRDAKYEFCWGRGLDFVRQSFDLGQEPVILCRNDKEVLCFDSHTKGQIECPDK